MNLAKQHLNDEENETVTNCNGLKMLARVVCKTVIREKVICENHNNLCHLCGKKAKKYVL
jgi:translation initiation factor IF-1